jgi:hypothetical protein
MKLTCSFILNLLRRTSGEGAWEKQVTPQLLLNNRRGTRLPFPPPFVFPMCKKLPDGKRFYALPFPSSCPLIMKLLKNIGGTILHDVQGKWPRATDRTARVNRQNQDGIEHERPADFALISLLPYFEH